MEKRIRLDKFLSNQGCGTRSEVRKLIFKGLVSVEGVVTRDIGQQIPMECKTVVLNGKSVLFETHAYIMLNKPTGVITATEDAKEKTVLDLIEHPLKKKLFPVGRLDKDTTGLLLLTNDGPLSHQLMSPKKHVDKKYSATLDGPMNETMIQRFLEGIILDDGYKTMPATLMIKSNDENGYVAEVIIKEGKYHQIKRMFAAVGREVIELHRIQMGTLILDPNLGYGEYRELTEEELRSLCLKI